MRQLVLADSPDSAGKARLADREYRYLVQVLRKTVGDMIEVRLPDGRLQAMCISSINRKEKLVFLAADGSISADETLTSADDRSVAGVSMPPLPVMPAGFPCIILFQWILKGPKMDQVIRQATETGVAFIVPVAGERCLSRDADAVGDGKTGRWERIVREARQQSGSPVATRVLAPIGVPEIADLMETLSAGKTALAMVLTEAPLARKSLHEYLVSGASLAALAIGAEGGMSAGELGLLAKAGFVCVHFRTNILRAETAALYGIAAVQSALTESEKWQLKESNC